jgi:hypothetical protein
MVKALQRKLKMFNLVLAGRDFAGGMTANKFVDSIEKMSVTLKNVFTALLAVYLKLLLI